MHPDSSSKNLPRTAAEARQEIRSEVSAVSESVDTGAAAPFFVRKPTVQKLVEGASVIFECQIGGSPKPHIYWKKSGIPLTTGYRFLFFCVFPPKSNYLGMKMAVICNISSMYIYILFICLIHQI